MEQQLFFGGSGIPGAYSSPGQVRSAKAPYTLWATVPETWFNMSEAEVWEEGWTATEERTGGNAGAAAGHTGNTRPGPQIICFNQSESKLVENPGFWLGDVNYCPPKWNADYNTGCRIFVNTITMSSMKYSLMLFSQLAEPLSTFLNFMYRYFFSWIYVLFCYITFW